MGACVGNEGVVVFLCTAVIPVSEDVKVDFYFYLINHFAFATGAKILVVILMSMVVVVVMILLGGCGCIFTGSGLDFFEPILLSW